MNVKKIIVGLVIGIFSCTIIFLINYADIDFLKFTRAEITNYLFIMEGGPLLGKRPARTDILIVREDEKTFRELQNIANPDHDAVVYQALFYNGAVVIGDTRERPLKFKGEEIMQVMVNLETKGRIFRNLFRVPEKGSISHGCPDLLKYHELSRDERERIRYYPAADIFSETLAMKLARYALSLPELATLPLNTREYIFDQSIPVPFVYRSTEGLIKAKNIPCIQIPYIGPAGGFQSISYIDVFKGNFSRDFFKGKIIIIDEEIDLAPTPCGGQLMTEGEITANVLQAILDRHFIRPHERIVANLFIMVSAFISSYVFILLRPIWAILCLIPFFALSFVIVVYQYRTGIIPDPVSVPAVIFLNLFGAVFYNYQTVERQRRKIHALFDRYVSKNVADELLKRPLEHIKALDGSKREVTILFADIRGFTPFATSHPPEIVVKVLNQILSKMAQTIFDNGGTLDKYLGDGIMAIFNAPLEQSNHALVGVQSACNIIEFLKKEQVFNLKCGIGIDTGEAISGNIGTTERLDYTVVGATVNIASRLCYIAGENEILVSERLYHKISASFDIEPLGPTKIKGLAQPLNVYRVLASRLK